MYFNPRVDSSSKLQGAWKLNSTPLQRVYCRYSVVRVEFCTDIVIHSQRREVELFPHCFRFSYTLRLFYFFPIANKYLVYCCTADFISNIQEYEVAAEIRRINFHPNFEDLSWSHLNFSSQNFSQFDRKRPRDLFINKFAVISESAASLNTKECNFVRITSNLKK